MYEVNLFRATERKCQKVIIRLTDRQRQRLAEMAKKAGMKTESKYVISLIIREHEDQLNEALLYAEMESMKDVGDDMPL
jgi:predicted DNA-binding protein